MKNEDDYVFPEEVRSKLDRLFRDDEVFDHSITCMYKLAVLFGDVTEKKFAEITNLSQEELEQLKREVEESLPK